MHSCESIAHTKLHWGRDNMQLSNVQYLHQSKQNGSFREEGYGAFRRTTCCSGKGKWFRQRCACYYLGDLWTGELTASSIQKKKKKSRQKHHLLILGGEVSRTRFSYLHGGVGDWQTDLILQKLLSQVNLTIWYMQITISSCPQNTSVTTFEN